MPSPSPTSRRSDLEVSVERTPGRQRLVGGVLKHVREPVLAAAGCYLDGPRLSCDWLFTHAGLVPGPYELESGITVHIPESLVSQEKHRVSRGVILEVVHG